ncbi:amino acid permease [Paenibacillus harenae]|uniref:amino acid permease n=1 Tax=Paenibacillus harenae TaxID=306543 RepID=UPI00040422AB|nr:amino acid permease [Paenibacillus harenae]
MLALIAGLVLTFTVSAAIMAGAIKAQQSVKSSYYQSMVRYGAETQLLQDKQDLKRFGLVQLLRRRSGGLAAFGCSFNVMGVVGCSAFLLGPALEQGGPSIIGFGLPILALFSLAVSASIAELASAVPTAGGIYHATSVLGGRSWGRRAGYLQALGHLAMLSLLNSSCAVLLEAFLSEKFGYEASVMSFWCVVAGLTALQGAVHHWGVSVMGLLQAGGVWLQALTAICMLGGLVWLFWPGGYSPAILYHFMNAEFSGKVHAGAFITGTLLLLKLFLGMDGASHVAEETMDPRIRAPWAIYLSTSYVYVIGIAMLTFMLLTAAIPLQSDGAGVFMQAAAAGWEGSAVIAGLILLSLWFSGLQSMGSCSRILYSLARDRELPFNRRWSAVSERRQSPLQAVWLSAAGAIAMIVAVYTFMGGGYLPILLSIAIVCLHLSYAIPISLKLIKGRQNRLLLDAPWRLGSWSIPVNGVSLAWLMSTAVLTSMFIHPAGAVSAAVSLLLAAAWGMRGLRGLRRLKLKDGTALEMKKENTGNIQTIPKKFPGEAQ